MKVLAADTSTEVISVSILDEKQLKGEIHQIYPRSQGSALIGVIKRLLEETNYNIKQIELFCVGLGPGSFTGLRASVATMRSLSIALKRPIIGISGFDAIADNCLGQDGRYLSAGLACRQTGRQVCVLYDAKQNKVYSRFYKSREGFIEPVTGFLLDSLENILGIMKESTIIAGDAIQVYGDKILEIKKDIVSFAPKDLWHPKAAILAKLALIRYEEGHTDNPFNLLPLYIYPKECQIKSQK